MDRVEEEVPVTNISGGNVANPENRPLGIGAKKKHKKDNNVTTSMFKRWKDKIDNV